VWVIKHIYGTYMAYMAPSGEYYYSCHIFSALNPNTNPKPYTAKT